MIRPFAHYLILIFSHSHIGIGIAYLLSPAFAGEKFHLTGQLSPSYETINYRSKDYRQLGGYKLSYNFGFEYKNFVSPVFSISTGLQLQNKGFKNILEFYRSDSTKFKDGSLIINAYYLMAPVDLNWDIQIFNKTMFVLSTGFSSGFLLRQEMVGRRIPEELSQPNPITGEPLDSGREKIDMFKRFYFGWNGGIGITQYIKSKLVLTIQPMYALQLNQLVDPLGNIKTNGTSPKFDSFAIHIRLGYYFNEQIANYEKEF